MRAFIVIFVAALAVTAFLPSAAKEQPVFGAVVVYAAPLDPNTPSGAAFSAASESDVLALAVEKCKAHTSTAEWGNCTEGRWIATGRDLLVAGVCDATDSWHQPVRLLHVLKDGVTATDAQIRDAVQRDSPDRAIDVGGCFKAAVFDRRKLEDTNLDDVETARSSAKDGEPH